LIDLRKKHPALSRGDYELVEVTKKRLIFKKKKDNDKVIVLISLEEEPFELNKECIDLISGESIYKFRKGIYYLEIT